jgi:hypothetical protein
MGFGFGFGFGLFLGSSFSSLGFVLTQFLSLLPKELIPHGTLELDGFLEVVGLWRKHGWSWGCV